MNSQQHIKILEDKLQLAWFVYGLCIKESARREIEDIIDPLMFEYTTRTGERYRPELYDMNQSEETR